MAPRGRLDRLDAGRQLAAGLDRLEDLPLAPLALSRSRADWGDLALPAPLRAQADEVWTLMSALADGEADGGRLDAARAAYVALYEQSEAIAQSSVEAARRRTVPAAGLTVPGARLLPARYRRRIPLHWRRRIVRALASR